MRLRNSGAVFFLSYDPARAATARNAHLAEEPGAGGGRSGGRQHRGGPGEQARMRTKRPRPEAGLRSLGQRRIQPGDCSQLYMSIRVRFPGSRLNDDETPALDMVCDAVVKRHSRSNIWVVQTAPKHKYETLPH